MKRCCDCCERVTLTRDELLAIHEALCFISQGGWEPFIAFLKRRNRSYGGMVEAIGILEHGADLIGKVFRLKEQTK